MRWYVSTSGQSDGPFEESDVAARFKKGELAGAQVCQEGAQTWQPIEAVPALAGGGSPAPAVPQKSAMPATMALDTEALKKAVSGPGLPPAGTSPGDGWAPAADWAPQSSPSPGISSPGVSSPGVSSAPGLSSPGLGGSNPAMGSMPGMVAAPEKKKLNPLTIAGGCVGAVVVFCCLSGGLVWALTPGEIEATVEGAVGTGDHVEEIEYAVETEEGMDVTLNALWDTGEAEMVRETADEEGHVTLRHARRHGSASVSTTITVRDPEDDDREPWNSEAIAVEMPPELYGEAGGLRCVGPAPCMIAWGPGATLLVTGPPGLSVTAAGQTLRLPENGRGILTFPNVASYAATANMNQLFRRGGMITTTFPIHVEFANGDELDSTLTQSGDELRSRISVFLETIENGPLQVPGAGTGTNVAYLPYASDREPSAIEGVGVPNTLSDIAYVGLAQNTLRDRGRCSYRNPFTRRMTYVRRSQVTAEVRLYERRTGRLLAEQTFRGSRPRCPRSMPLGRTIYGTPNASEVQAWLRANAHPPAPPAAPAAP